ncbi:MAG: Dabb family protein [Verrucomicrobiales bacterium]|nr:Dabb family protein [Verrucomicrobiales bacterium]
MFDRTDLYAKGFEMKFLRLLTLILSFSVIASPALADSHEGPPFRHAVFFKFKETATDNDIQRIVDEFMMLQGKIDTIVDIEWGFSESVEGLNDEFTHAFLVTFKDKAGLETYIPHPDHMAFVEILKPHLDKVFVFDYTARK